MKRIFAVIFMMLLLAVPAWATDYYVSTTGSDMAPYNSVEKAATTIKTVTDYIANYGNPGSTVYISEGTFGSSSDYFKLISVNLAGTTFVGSGNTKTIISTNTQSYTANIGADVDYVTFSELTLKNTRTINTYGDTLTTASGCVGLTVNDCILISSSTTVYNVKLLGDDSTFNRVEFRYTGGSHMFTIKVEDGDADLNYCLFRADTTAKYGGGIWQASTGTTNINNCEIMDAGGHGVYASSGVVNIRNSIVQAGINNHNSFCVRNNGATVNAYNNLWLPALWIANATTNLTIDSNNQESVLPKFISKARGGFIIPWVDDLSNLDYALSVATLLGARSMQGCFAVPTAGIDSTDATELKTMVSGGNMEVTAHSWSHPNLSYTHGIYISYSGTDSNPTVTVTSSEIQLTTDEGNDDLIIDRSTDTTFGDINAYSGEHNWVINNSTTDGQTGNFSTWMLTSSLVSSMSATAAPCDIDLDRSGISSGYFKNEIADNISQLEGWIGDTIDPQTGVIYKCTDYVAPYGGGDSDVKAAVMAAGYKTFRWVPITPYEKSVQYMVHCDLFAMFSASAHAYFSTGAGESVIRAQARNMGFAAAHTGMVLAFLAHKDSELTLDEWGYVLDEWSKIDGLTVTSMQLVVKKLEADWADAGNGVYIREFTAEPDYHLTKGSPCRDAGIEISGVTDSFYGTAPDIGAFEYQPPIVIDIKINHADGPLAVQLHDPASMEIALNTGNYAGLYADWWFIEITPSGQIRYLDIMNYPVVDWRPGIKPTYQGPLFDIPLVDFLKLSTNDPGEYVFYFAVDLIMNGTIDFDALYYDCIEIEVQ